MWSNDLVPRGAVGKGITVPEAVLGGTSLVRPWRIVMGWFVVNAAGNSTRRLFSRTRR